MPELPEVETIRRDLEQAVVGRKVKSVEVRVDKLFQGDPVILIGKKLKKVERIGKMLVLHYSNGVILVIHLKMTGQLIFLEKMTNSKFQTLIPKSPPWRDPAGAGQIRNLTANAVIGGHPDKVYNQPLPHKYTHIIITFTDGSTLYYNDLRKFGWMKIVKISKIKSQNHNSNFKIGIDALSKKITANYLHNRCNNRKTTIKQLLLNQQVIAGIGNIYSDEILFCAGALPFKQAGELNEKELNKIAICIPKILNKSIAAGGTSRSDYRKLDGSKGGYLDMAWVYGRAGDPCRVCKQPIKRTKIGQRSSHYCPNCQN